MTVTKHGKFYSDIKDHIDLYGKCNRCGCEFKTFVDLYWGTTERGGVTLITDPSCKIVVRRGLVKNSSRGVRSADSVP